MSTQYKLKDLAKMLHMSPSTVSKALNDYPSISKMTKDRVKELAKKVNFIPDQTAISFKSKRSFSIGVIIPNLLDQFYTLAVSGIEEYAMENSYKAIVSQHYEDVQREIEICDMMSKNRIDGLIVSITKDTQDISHFRRLEEMGIPVVYLVRRPANTPCFNVTSNVYKGTMDAVSFLVDRGHKRIGHIMGPSGLLTTNERSQGYIDGLKKNKIPFDKSLLYSSDLTTDSTISALEKLLQLKSPPTAIIAFKDYIALDAMQHLKTMSKKKKNIEFVGFGNLPMLKYLDNPPIASLEEECTSLGRAAGEMLMNRIKQPDQTIPAVSLQFECTLKQLK